MNWHTALRLGRISNLPTIWSNVLAALVLAGGLPLDFTVAGGLLLSLSLFYIAGMYFNDWCDREYDAVHCPTRPIPAQAVGAGEVLFATILLFGLALLLLLGVGYLAGTGWQGGLVGVLLLLMIVVYDLWHKKNAFAPVLMGVCRALVYAVTAVTVVLQPSLMVGIAALLLGGYVVVLTYVARHEHHNRVQSHWLFVLFLLIPLWAVFYVPASPVPLLSIGLIVGFIGWIGYSYRLLQQGQVGQMVMSLIAGISIVDALFIALVGEWIWVGVALGCLPLTRFLQRYIAGT